MKKVFKAHPAKNGSAQYNLVGSEVNFDDKTILTYGIEIVESIASGKKQTTEILDITANYEKAEVLFDKIVRSEIAASSLKDIVDDFIIS